MKKDIQNLYKSIGQKIRAVRKLKEMTLEDLAFKVDMDWSFLARIETGKAVASVETLYKISKALNVQLSKLFEKATPTKYELVDTEFNSLINNISIKEKQKSLSILKLVLSK